MEDAVGIGAAAGGLIAGVVFYFALIVGVYVWVSLAFAAMFRKTGSAPWKAWVPVVREWHLFKHAGMSPIWAIVIYAAPLVVWIITFVMAGGLILQMGNLAAQQTAPSSALGASLAIIIVPFVLMLAYSVVQLIIMILMVHRITVRFGLGAGTTVLGVFLYPVWASVLGWGSARWQGESGTDARSNTQQPRSAPPQYSDTPAPTPTPNSPAPTINRFAPPPAPAQLAHGQPAAAGSSPASVQVTPAPAGSQWAPPPAPAPAAVTQQQSPEAQQPLLPRPTFTPDRPETAVLEGHPTELTGSSEIVGGPEPMSAVHHAAREFPLANEPQAEAPSVGDFAGDFAGDFEDHTVLAARNRTLAQLVLPTGETVELTEATVLIGRNPAPSAEDESAQLISVDDSTKTVSKTHARLVRDGERWLVTDLGSTNGVVLVDEQGAETEVNHSSEVSGAFMLGDATFVLNSAG